MRFTNVTFSPGDIDFIEDVVDFLQEILDAADTEDPEEDE